MTGDSSGIGLAFATRPAARGSGRLILLSSLVAFRGAPFAATYGATKSFVQALAEGLAVELKGTGVHVLSCAPGPTRNNFADRAGMTMAQTASPQRVAEATFKRLGRSTTVAPGLLAKFLQASLSTLPRRGRVAVMKRVVGSMAGTTTLTINMPPDRNFAGRPEQVVLYCTVLYRFVLARLDGFQQPQPFGAPIPPGTPPRMQARSPFAVALLLGVIALTAGTTSAQDTSTPAAPGGGGQSRRASFRLARAARS